MVPNKKKALKYEHFDSLLAHDSLSDFMSKPPITLTKDATMIEAKALMRDHRISGIPIVDEEGGLLGLVSLENIILALENYYLGDPIEKHMVRDVVYLTEDMNVTTVIEYLMTYNYGRYPVVNKDNKVVGVVTSGDLILHILERVGNVYLHNKRRDEILAPSKNLLSPEKFVCDKSFTYSIHTTDMDRAGEGSTLFKKHLQQQGFPPDIIRRASIALYEAEVNVVIHAYGEGEIKGSIEDNQLFIMVTDNGPGIDNIELAMQPGYSTASDEVRERGFGAGMGLANIKNYTDKLVILSSENGVRMEMVLVAKDKIKTTLINGP